MTFSDFSNKKKKKVEEAKSINGSSGRANMSGVVNKIASGAKKTFDSASQVVRQESRQSQPYISQATINSGGLTFNEWSDLKYGNTRNVSDWVRDTYDVVNRLGDYYGSYKVRDDEKYQSYQKELSDLLSEGVKWRGIHNNERSLAEINSVTDMLSNNKRYATRARDYWAQWDTEEDYNAAMEKQKQYDDLRNYDVIAGEKEIEEIQAVVDEYMSLSGQAGYGKFSTITYQSPLTRFGDKTKGQIDARLAEIEEQYGDINAIRNSLSEKKKYLAEAKRLQDGIRLSSVNSPDSEFYDPDFKEYSVFDDQEQDDLYTFINGGAEYQWSYKAKADNPVVKGFLDSYTDKNYQYMTEDEIGIFNYYYAKDGKGTAQQYLDSIQETLNHRSGGIMRAGVYDSKPLQLVFSLQAGMDQFSEGMENISSYLKGDNEYKPASDMQIASSMVRDDISKDGFVWQAAYDAASSIGNMFPSILTTAMVGAINPVAGSIAGRAVFGGSIAGNSYQEMINLGYDVNQSKAYATATALSEVLLESLLGGISGLGGKMMPEKLVKLFNKIKNVDNALAQVAIKLGSHMKSEAFEEGLQEVLDPWLKNMILGTDESVDWAEVGYSALLGALTAGILEGGSVTAGEYNVYTLGKDLKSSGVSVKELSDMGSKMSADSVAYRLAGKVDENTGAYKIGRLFNEVGATLTEMNQADITKSLVRKGIAPSDADIISKTLADVVNGKVLTDKQAAVLNANDLVSKTLMDVIINPNSTVNQRMHGYNEMLMKLAEEKSRGEVMQNATAEADPFMSQKDMERELQRYHQITEENKAINNPETSQVNENSAIRENIKVSKTNSASLQSTSEDIEVKSIDSIKNGQMKLKLEDGRVVNADDVLYASEADAIIYKTVADMNLNEKAANMIVNSYALSPDISADVYVRGINEAYRYGAFNYPVGQIANGPFASMLTEYQRNMAYNLGKLFEGKRVAVEEARIREAVNKNKESNKKARGEVHYDGIDQTKLTEIQKNSISALEKIADAVGVDIHLFESSVDEQGKRVGANGWFDSKTNSIHIDIHAGQSGAGTILFTAAHELTHFIKEWSPAKFKTLANFLMREYGKRNISVETLVQNQIAKAKRSGRDISYDTAYEEVIADSMESMLVDGKIVEKLSRLCAEDKGLWQKIKDYVKDLAAKIKQIYNGLSPDSAEGRYVAEMSDVIDELKEAFEASLIEAGENYRASGSKESMPAVKESIRDSFYDEIDAWDGKTDKTFVVGETSDVLKSIGIKDGNIIWHSKKVAAILKKHKNMTRDIIKQVPQVLENPIIVLKSQQSKSRLAIFGEVIDTDGAPVTAILELLPTNKRGQVLNMSVIASAYGKNSNPARFVQNSEVVYLSENKNRTRKWLQGLGLQLPSDITILGSIGKISYADGKVNIQSVPFEQIVAGENYKTAENSEVSKNIKNSIRDSFYDEIDAWNKNRQPDGERFILGSTSDVIQGLGAIESDIYMLGDKIKKILVDHPEMTINEIKKIPQLLENPVMVLESKNARRSGANTRMVVFGTVKAQNGLPINAILDLRPSEKNLVIDDMQKVSSAYTKDVNPKSFVEQSNVLYLDKKKATSLLRSIGFLAPIELNDSDFIGSISYVGRKVKLNGIPFEQVVKVDENANQKFSDRYLEEKPNEEILSMIDRVSQGQYKDNEKVIFGMVPENVAKEIYNLTKVNVDGFQVAIEARQIAHIIKDHGAEGITDHSMADVNHIARMEYILTSPDSIVNAGKTKAYSSWKNGKNRPSDTVLYEKVVGEKSYYVVQAVANTKTKTLYVVSAFIGKSEYKKGGSQSANAQSPDATSEIDAENTPLSESIHNDSTDVNIYSDRDYSYDSLVSKPDMQITTLSNKVPNTRADVVAQAKQNAAKIGKVNPKDGSVSVHVEDIGRDVLLSTNGLKHGLDRRLDVNGPATLQAGEILKNSIQINELNPKHKEADGSYILIGAAKNTNGDFYVVRSVVNIFSSELASMDVLYSVNTKNKNQLRSMRPGFQRPVTGSTISISKLLDYVNEYFPDILPEDVLKHYGHTARPAGDLADSVLYSDRDYSYDSLVSKPDMKVTILSSQIPNTRAEVIAQAKENATKIGKLGEHGNPLIYVEDIKGEVMLSNKGLRHGLDRRFDINAPVTLKAGEILQNAIQVNELTPDKSTIDTSYVLIGVAKNIKGEPYVVQFVINRATNEVTSVDVLYAINAKTNAIQPLKKESTGSLSPEITNTFATLTDSKLSISKLLDYVNQYFPDVLSEDVLRHYGHTERPKGKLGQSALYSDRDPLLDKVNASLEKENERLKADIIDLKELLKIQKSITNGTKFTKTSVEAAAGHLMNLAKARGDKAEFVKKLNTFYEYLASSDNLTWEEISEQAQPVIGWLQENVSKKRELDGYAVAALNEIRKSKISLNEEQKAEVVSQYGSYNDYRKSLLGSVTISDSDAISLDQRWNELSTMYPDVFSQEVSSGDQPAALAEAIDTLRSMDLSPVYEQDMVEQELRGEVYDSFWRVSTLRTVADVKQKQINMLKGKHYAAMDKLRADHKANVAKLKSEYREEIKAVKKEYRENAEAKQKEIIQHYQEARKRNVEGRRRTQMRHKIASVVKELNDLLLKETKEKHVPIELQKAVAEALDAVNMDTVGAESRIANLEADLMKAKTPEKAQEIARTIERVRRMGDRMDKRIRSLKDAYAKIVNSSDPLIANSYDEVIANKIESVMESVMDTPLRDMTMQQLEDVYDLYTMVRETVRNANKAFKMNKTAGIREMGEAVMQELESEGSYKKQRTKAGRKVSAFSWNNLKSIYAFKRIGSDTLTELYKNVRKGEDTWAVDMIEAKKFYDEQYKKYGYDSWDFDERYEFKSSNGKEFSLSLDQIMSLYAYSKRKQVLAHLKEGGIVFDANTEHVVKKWLNVPVKVKIEDAQTYQLSDDVLQKIIGKLSAKQKAFVDTMQEYLSSTMGEKGNEVSLMMYGIKLFKEKSYFPLKSAEQYLVKAREQQEVEVKIKNKGFTRELRENAQNPVVLTPFMDVWADHVDQMSMYHALTLPLEDFYRVYNYESRSEDGKEKYSINASIQSAHGIAATAYINQFLKDVNGGVIVDTRENITNGLISKFKKASVLSSMSVVIQQPSAICRAWSMIDLKYFRPTVDEMKHKQLWEEEVKKYAPVAVIKEMGYFDTGMGRNARDLIKDQGYDGLLNKIKGFVKDGNYRDEVLSKLPGLADEVTWCAIWNATKRQVFHEHSNMNPRSEEFLKLVGEKFTDVITETQVYDSVFSRSANMRSKSKLMNMWTAFMAEPTTSINMLEEAMRQAKKGNKRAAARMVGSVFASVFLNSVLASLVYAARDDDEDDTFLEKYVASFVSEMLEGVNPITYYPVLKDIWSIAQGYDVERTDMSLISSLAKSLERCTKVIGKDTSNMDEEELAEHGKQVEKAMWNVVDDFSSFLGIPVKNIRRELVAARRLTSTIEKDMSGRKTSWGSLMDKLSQTVKDATPIYSWMPDKQKTDRLYDAIVGGDKAYIDRFKSSYDTESSFNMAMRKALRDNDPRIRAAARARAAGDIQKYTSIAKEIIAEGFFTQDLVVKAINNEVTSLSKEDGSSTASNKVIGFYKAEDFGVAILRNNAGLADAVKNDVIQTAQANGKTLEEATRSFESSAKNNLKEKLIAGELKEDQVIDALVKYCNVEYEEAEKKTEEWVFEAEYGFSYADRGDAYKSGQISASELCEVLISVGGKSQEEANLQIEIYDWQKEVPGCEGITASAIKDYNENCNPVGISRRQYYEAWRYYQDTSGDYDEAGESIPYSKVNKVMPYIDSLPLSNDQKTALALCWWSEGTVYKYKVW